jgi:hypothetical protein
MSERLLAQWPNSSDIPDLSIRWKWLVRLRLLQICPRRAFSGTHYESRLVDVAWNTSLQVVIPTENSSPSEPCVKRKESHVGKWLSSLSVGLRADSVQQQTLLWEEDGCLTTKQFSNILLAVWPDFCSSTLHRYSYFRTKIIVNSPQ